MKKLTKILVTAVLGVFLIAGSSWAAAFGDGGTALQGVLDGITVGGNSSVNVVTDELNDSVDSYWDITASGGSVATLIIELAGYAGSNTFGVYNDSKYVELFAGANIAGDQVMLSIQADGGVRVGGTLIEGVNFASTNFGYYLDSSYYDNGGLFHSNTALNDDESDHMYAYQGTGDIVQIAPWASGAWTPSEYVLAFEDLKASVTDGDYTDMVVMVESVLPSPVPEPTTIFLSKAGLLGLAAIGRKKYGKK